MKKVNIALLGMGRIGKIHFRNIGQHFSNASIVAVADPQYDEQTFKNWKRLGNCWRKSIFKLWQTQINLYFCYNPFMAVGASGIKKEKFETEIKEQCEDGAWETHIRAQLVRCLNFRLWDEADSYFARTVSRDRRYRLLQICRRLHLPPSSLSRTRRILTAR